MPNSWEFYDDSSKGGEDKFVHYLETKFKVNVIQDDEGTTGVEVMDDDGGGYPFQRVKHMRSTQRRRMCTGQKACSANASAN